MAPGDLLVVIDDRQTTIEMAAGGTWTLPIGPVALLDTELDGSGRPAPEQLTNALGIVTDHLDDVIRESPTVEAAARVALAGPHARALARVEVGSDHVETDYELERAAADEVFRTLVAETVAERRHNPGLRPEEAETIIGTCCVVLALMRRLELTSVAIAPAGGDA
ncbi:hypothetical protein [Ilumatobacter sp.]|uniref:hypothetical protein n=1 Tax=Ilumatobacter sp. TaxID=1967498 RepID=UPI003B525D96